MSSTGRQSDRNEHDYYVTPIKPIKQFLGAFLQDEGIDRPDKLTWLDPCAGGDEKNGMSYADTIAEEFEPDQLYTMDIRGDSRAERKGDYLKTNVNGLPLIDIIISNPPFNLAQDFIQKALYDVEDGGYVIMLLRLNFLGSKKREALFKEHMPHSIYVHSRRMSFTENGGTDSIEYAHFVWKKGENPLYSKLYHIDG